MKYYLLVRNHDYSLTRVTREYKSEDLNRFAVLNSYLEKYNELDRAWRVLYINMITQRDYITKLKEYVIDPSIQLTQKNLEITQRALNVDLFNVLSSFYFYCEFCKTNFKRWFETQPEHLEFVNKKLSEYFDNYFEYRFFYKLRNYANHCGLPIQVVINAAIKADKHKLLVVFDTDYLLRNYQWGKIVSLDIEQRMPSIPMFQTTINFSIMITELHKEINDYLKEIVKPKALQLLDEFYEYDLDQVSLSILEYSDEKDINKVTRKGEILEGYGFHILTDTLKQFK